MPSLDTSLSLNVVIVAPVSTRNSTVAYMWRNLDSSMAVTYAASSLPGLKTQGIRRGVAFFFLED